MKTYAADGVHRVTLTLNGMPRSGLAESRTLLTDGPRFTAVMIYVTVSPTVMLAGPCLKIARSACAITLASALS